MKIRPYVLFLTSALFIFASMQPVLAFNWFGREQKKKAVKVTPPSARQETVKAAALPKTPDKKNSPPPDQRESVLPGLEERLANNRSMTADEKADLIGVMKKQFPKNMDFHDKKFEKDALYFEQVANDPNMKTEEKKAAIHARFGEQPTQPAGEQEKPVEAQPMKQEVKQGNKAKKHSNNFA